MGIYPNYKSIKGIKILDWNNGVTIYEYGLESILNNEEIIKAQNIYNNLPNKEGIEIRVYVLYGLHMKLIIHHFTNGIQLKALKN